MNPATGSSEAREWPVVEVRRLDGGRPGLFHWNVLICFTYEGLCPYEVLKRSWFCYDRHVMQSRGLACECRGAFCVIPPVEFHSTLERLIPSIHNFQKQFSVLG